MESNQSEPTIVLGVDTHKDTHTVTALDLLGKHLSTATFSTDSKGYTALLAWALEFGFIDKCGIEGTSSYGAGLTRFLRKNDIKVVEVCRPNRQLRRRKGKSDPVDSESAARTVLAGDELGAPKSQDGGVEMIRLFKIQRKSAIKARTQAGNQIHAIISTAPDELRATLRNTSLKQLIPRLKALRPGSLENVSATVKYALKGLAKRWGALQDEIKALDKLLTKAVQSIAPKLAELHGVGTEVASTLLIAAGDNPERLKNESSFAALCGVSPLDASSGKQSRHRLNRGGNRDANRALWVIAFVRFRIDERTKEYTAKRMKQGRTKLEVIRCLKRYIAREVYKIIVKVPLETSS